jgi:hypothetical protein
MRMMLLAPLVVNTGIILVYASPFPVENGTLNEDNVTNRMVDRPFVLDDNDLSFFSNYTNNTGNETGLINGTDIHRDILIDNEPNFL